MQHQRSSVWLFGRSLLPSTTSAIFCVIGSLAVVAGGILLASLNYGTLLPNFADGELAAFYTNAIVQPLVTLLNSASWSSAIVMLVWGLVASSYIASWRSSIHAFENWREAKSDIQMISENVVVRHPLERSFAIHSLWHFGMSVVSVLFVVAVQPVVQHTFTIMRALVSASAPGVAVRQLLFAIGAWIVIFHVSIVLLRLYTLRTRLFGDNAAY